MTDAYRLGANLATLGNALLGVGAIAYVFAGNSMWAMLLIVGGLALDGLDGVLSRRSSTPPALFGRVADSVADAITFGGAPAALLIVHSYNPVLWAPVAPWTLVVGFLVLGLAVIRLTYYTLRSYQLPYFLGAPTPLTAIAIVVVLLFCDQPAFWGTDPVFVLAASAAAAVCMVIPIRFPKVRRGEPVRLLSVFIAVALVLALVPLQFQPAPGTPLYSFALIAAAAGGAALLAYYIWGPLTVRDRPKTPEGVVSV